MFSSRLRLCKQPLSIEPVISGINATSGVTTSVVTQPQPNFETLRQNYMPSVSVGTKYLARSSLWDLVAVRAEDGMKNVLNVFANNWLREALFSGPGERALAAEAGTINPAWRQTVVHVSNHCFQPLQATKGARLAYSVDHGG